MNKRGWDEVGGGGLWGRVVVVVKNSFSIKKGKIGMNYRDVYVNT